jgi:hypothetical protein
MSTNAVLSLTYMRTTLPLQNVAYDALDGSDAITWSHVPE